ncbi:hypothetical protein FLA105534_00943 [Flavobacterium bizetiae]|uniref:Uncharacterized protein n=1 Tax=Flavobacterium bizetiae TaxID=2704140 RepID=A0A6J4GDH3_9FLAO|nr:hypothetical protein [Flavobacterium bizetiae]CAA9196050.1 hypothetical protein FLA105534_00943 [Flavobacterium bizetiae]CAD5341952.1 hypothetical protein FLA105535_01930 [Flavobacterium bizetiae]CAD5346574.1 hypothetical protein FLA105534_00515 [Flavobacterium bizetiae]
MNPKILITSIFVTSLVLTSCKKELEPQENTPTSELVKLGLAKDTTKTPSVVQNPATNPNTVMSDTKGINPAHGQPGHRCDIAVGAPLNSAPAQQGQTATQTSQPVQVNAGQQQVVTTTATPVKVAKGMNPAHGQPGHRCDIPVGSPLNSPVAKPATNTAQSGTTSQNFTVTPPPANNAVPALLSTEEAVADGMNPAHGKPGHRCDIAVGAPLPKS